MTKNEVLFIALNDAQDNGDLFFSMDETEDAKAQEILDVEIKKLAALIKSEADEPTPVERTDFRWYRGRLSVKRGTTLAELLLDIKEEPTLEQAKHDINLGLYMINRVIVKDVDFQFTQGANVLWFGQSEYNVLVN